MYLVQIAIFSVVFSINNNYSKNQIIVLGVIEFLAMINFVSMRLMLVRNLTRRNLIITTFFVVSQEILLLVLLIVNCLIHDKFGVIGSAFGLFIQSFSILILKGFYSKLTQAEVEEHEIKTRVSSMTGDIKYAYTSGISPQNGEMPRSIDSQETVSTDDVQIQIACDDDNIV
jgi:hypothetical protein